MSDDIDTALRSSLLNIKKLNQQLLKSTKSGKHVARKKINVNNDYFTHGINSTVKGVKAADISHILLDTAILFSEELTHKLERLVTLTSGKSCPIVAAVTNNLGNIFKELTDTSCLTLGIKKVASTAQEDPFKPLRDVISREGRLLSQLVNTGSNQQQPSSSENQSVRFTVDGSSGSSDNSRAASGSNATAKTSPPDDLPEELQVKLAEFHEQFGAVAAEMSSSLSVPLVEVERGLDALQRAKFELTSLYSVNSLFWMYLCLHGIDPKTHPVKKELERIRDYMRRVKVIEDQPRAPRIDKGAAKRFVRSALWDPNTTRAKKVRRKGKGDGTVGQGEGTVGQGEGTVGQSEGTVGQGEGTVGQSEGKVGQGECTVGQDPLEGVTVKSEAASS